MTLIIGIKCRDGIVMGADGAATLGTMGQRTILQPMRKLETIAGKVIFGFSGQIGLGQRFKYEVQKAWENKEFSGVSPCEAMTTLRVNMWKHVEMELKAATIARGAIGSTALQSVISQTIIAMPVSKKPCLFQFDQQCSPEEATTDLPFVSIGSGQGIADPFLAFLRRIFWRNKVPSIADGLFVTLWTLRHAIQINPGGVAEPIQMVILENKDGDWKARELLEEELQEHLEAIDAAENSLLKFRDTIKNQGEEIKKEPSKIPEPPPS
ncbi:MAG: hypothetical protein ACTSPI_16220 [Candidatus Heimdallarchaeaceae archaeon]